MKIILITLLLFFVSIYPQGNNSASLFDKYIPDIIKIDKKGLDQIYENIIWTSELHPSLLYYYFEHLNLHFNANIINPDSNRSRVLFSQRNQVRKQRNNFALREEKLIKEKKYVGIKHNAMISCIEDLFTYWDQTLVLDTSFIVDKNKQDFYSFIYFSGESEDYNPLMDYSNRLQNTILKKISYFNDKSMNFSNMNKKEKQMFINELNRYWYFVDKEETTYSSKLDFELNELVQEIYINDFYINEKFGIEIFYHPVNINLETKEMINTSAVYKSPKSTGSGLTYNTQAEIKTNRFLSIFGTYRILIEKEYEAFNYVDAKLGISLNEIEFAPPFGTHFFSFSGKQPGKYIDAFGYMDKESAFTYSILLKTVIPVFYLNPVFNVKVGCLYELRLNNFDYSILVEETITDLQGNQTHTTMKEIRNYSNSNHFIWGIISINAKLSNQINTILEGNISKKLGFGLGVNYSF